MYNQQFPQYQQPMGYPGMVPQQPAMPKMGSWLTPEKYELLKKTLTQFNLSVTDKDLAKGQCNHYHQNGVPALVPDPIGDGSVTCSICGTKFNTSNMSSEEVKTCVDNILNILNTIKIMYLSLDPNAALEYFQIIPFIEKIPQLYEIAVQDFKKYEGVGNFIPNQQNPFNLFNSMVAGQAMGYGYQQQPMGYAQQPMGYAQAPIQQPVAPMTGYPQQQPMGYNPMYSAQAPVAGYQPQQNGYAFNPQGAAVMNTNMPVQPQGGIGGYPQAPVQQQPVAAPATETVKVDTQFKK